MKKTQYFAECRPLALAGNSIPLAGVANALFRDAGDRTLPDGLVRKNEFIFLADCS
jgi:hypothetical protein